MECPLLGEEMRWREMKRKTIDLNGGEKGPVLSEEDQHERKDR